MRLAPFNVQAVLQLAVATLALVVPLKLTMISLDELLTQALRMVLKGRSLLSPRLRTGPCRPSS